MAPAIAANPGHTAYFYCFDTSDPNSISAFQQYASVEASQKFLKADSYAEYLIRLVTTDNLMPEEEFNE